MQYQHRIFLYCSPYSSCSFNFAIAKIVAFFLFCTFIHFLYCSPYGYRSSNYRNSNSSRIFLLLKTIAKVKKNISLSERERVTTIVEGAKSIDREWKERSKEIIAKIKQRRLRDIKIKIQKSPILLLPFWQLIII